MEVGWKSIKIPSDTLDYNTSILISSIYLIKVDQLDSKVKLGSYLAGLIEGDGHIYVPSTKRDSKGKLLAAHIEIVFHMKDLVLAKFIQNKVGGYMSYRKNSCILIVKKLDLLVNLVNLINGYFRTPKIIVLHKLILFLNVKLNIALPLLGIDYSNLNSNAWLAGFWDADGSFYFTWKMGLLKKGWLPTKLAYYMRLSQNSTYAKTNLSNFPILNLIASFMKSSIKFRERHRTTYTEKVINLRTENWNSKYILISYFLKFPLYSYKYSSVPVFVNLLQISVNKKLGVKENENQLIALKHLKDEYSPIHHANHIKTF